MLFIKIKIKKSCPHQSELCIIILELVMMHLIPVVVYLILFQLLSFSLASDRFYVYDWPTVVNRYANFSDRPHHGHGVEFPQWREHYGAGRLIDANNSEHKTSQFGLFKLMYERALIDPRRTLNPTEAVSFLIPYDFGMDATFFETNGRMRKTQCPLADSVLKLLKASPYFHAKNGHDHTLIVSVNQNMDYFFGAHACMNIFHICWNCTKVSIDEYMFIAKNRNHELKKRGINWHAVPFPSDYHYTGDYIQHNINSKDSISISTAPWERPSKVENRSVLISFLGNARKFSQINTLIREALVAQCQNHTDICSHGTYKHDTTAGISGPNLESRHAIFCLQPPGDMPTRKSVFDSILSGCIPVLFHPLTARYMYEWHLKQTGWEKIALNFDKPEENQGLLNGTLNIMTTLHDIYINQPELIAEKRQYIRDNAHQLQFSLIKWNNITKKAEITIKKDKNNELIPDAYHITMRNLLDLHTGNMKHDRKSEFLSCDQLSNSPAQTSDNCKSLSTIKDPYYPPSVVSVLYKT